MYGGCTADVPEDAVRTPYRCRTDTVRTPYGRMGGCTARNRGYRTDTVQMPYGHRTGVRGMYGAEPRMGVGE